VLWGQHRLDADRHPDPDQTFHFDVDPDPDIHLLEIRIFLLLFTAELVYIFFVSIIGVIIFNILDNMGKFSVKKKYSLSLHLIEINPYPDWQAPDADKNEAPETSHTLE
jgi:hypothetical protein